MLWEMVWEHKDAVKFFYLFGLKVHELFEGCFKDVLKVLTHMTCCVLRAYIHLTVGKWTSYNHIATRMNSGNFRTIQIIAAFIPQILVRVAY